MNPPSSSPPLLRPIFVSPSSTVLLHDVTAEWDALRARESLMSRAMPTVLGAAKDLNATRGAGPLVCSR